MSYTYTRLATHETQGLRTLNEMFAEAFEDSDTYLANTPSDEYLCARLSDATFIAIGAHDGEKLVGGIVAYVLHKFEQERSEIYLYDLAVLENHRRRGVATGLIEELKRVAKEIGAYAIFVQADAPDSEARAFYRSLGAQEEDVRHYDILP